MGELDVKHLEVLRLMAAGYTNEHIAQHMDVARSTVERWESDLCASLGVDTKGGLNPRIEAVRQYIAAVGIPRRE